MDATAEAARELRLVADPTRAQILRSILDAPDGRVRVGRLEGELGLRQPTVSLHMKALLDEGLVVRRPDGRRTWYSLDPAHADRIAEMLGSPDDAVPVDPILEADSAQPDGVPEVLFVCVQNAGRSQMASAILRHLVGCETSSLPSEQPRPIETSGPMAAAESTSIERAPIARRLLAEFLGTALLVAIVVGSGIAASSLSPRDVGLQLLENSIATALGLAVLIAVFASVSGAHFNPIVTGVDWALGRRNHAFPVRDVIPYALAQVAGAIAGAVLANVMFEVPAGIATTERVSTGSLVAEVVATAGLVLVIFGLVRSERSHVIPGAVGAYIGAAYWFTSSTSFANPAVTIGRVFTDTFAGIAPTSVLPFIVAQVLGAALGAIVVWLVFPETRRATATADSPEAALANS